MSDYNFWTTLNELLNELGVPIPANGELLNDCVENIQMAIEAVKRLKRHINQERE